MGDLPNARKAFEQALRLQPNDPLTLANIAMLEERQGRPDEAEPLYRAAILNIHRATEDQAADLMFNYALFLNRERRDLDASAKYYQKCLDINPAHRRALNNLGCHHLARGDLDVAVEYLDKARRLEPRNAGLLLNLAYANQRLGKRKQAKKLAQKAFAINPKLKQTPLGKLLRQNQ